MRRPFALFFIECLMFGGAAVHAQAGQSREEMVQRYCHAPEVTSGPEFNRIEAIHTRLAPVFARADVDADVQVAVVASGPVNAWHQPLGPESGLICIPVTMVRFIGQSEGEMAFIVAHELGHALDGACRSDAGRAQLARPTVSGALDRLLGGTGRNALEEQRTCESRADEIGFQIIKAARYNPFDAAGAFGRLEMLLDDSGVVARLMTAFYKDHPVTPDRIRHMRMLMIRQTQQ